MSRIISSGNLYSKISEFLFFLFNHMHEFFHFYLFIIFPGFYNSTQPKTKKHYDYPTSKQYKKTLINLFSLYCIKKLHEEEKKLKASGPAHNKSQG